jgi:tetratricopeptide (TPR) repeat protein
LRARPTIGDVLMDAENQREIDTVWDEAKGYIDQGNFDKAIEIYKYILIRYDDNPIAFEYANAYLGDAYLTLRKLDGAESHIKKAISCNPEKPGYHYLLGFVYSILCYWRKAIKEFELAVKVEPDNAEYLRGLGWAIFNGGEKLKGLEYLRKANKLEPSNVNVLLDLANTYLLMLDFRKAKMYGKKALLIDPSYGLTCEVLDKIEEFHKMYMQPKVRRKQSS